MGTLIRSSFGFGVDAVVVVEGCDPWAPKTIQAMGTSLQLPVVETSWDSELKEILQNPSIEAVERSIHVLILPVLVVKINAKS